MKGFIISFDAVIALIISFAMLVAISGNFAESQFSSLNETKLALISEDVLTVLEKNGKLDEAIKQNKNNEISKYLNKTSKNLCFELNMYDYDNNSSALNTVTKTQCKKTPALNEISTKRSFFYNEKFYWAELKAWFKVTE